MKARILILLSVLSLWMGACKPLPLATNHPQASATLTSLPPKATFPVPTATLAPSKVATPTGAASLTPAPYFLPPLPEESGPTVAEILSGLESLPLDEFFEKSYKQLLLRSPQTITELGLSAAYGLRDNRLDNLSDGYLRDTQALEAGILALLQTYDRETLLPEEQISYDVYVWYLENQVSGHAFMYYDFPLHHFLGSWQFDLQALLTEKQPLQTRQNAEDYIYRLLQVEEQAQQLREGLEIRAQLGIIPPRYILELTEESLYADLQVGAATLDEARPENLAVYTHFKEGVQAIEELTPAEKQALQLAALRATADVVIPAYRLLLDTIDQLMPLAGETAGVGQFLDGEAYYAYLLRSETSTDLTPAEAHEIGLQEVARLQAEMRAAFTELSYPEDEALGVLVGRAVQAGGFYNTTTSAGQQKVVAAYESILAAMEARLGEIFEMQPAADLIVRGAPFAGGGFYEPASLDGSRPGVFYAGTGGGAVPKFNMATIAYHEAIPGHHFQIALAQDADLPLFRNVLFFNGYSEGWAVYSERLGWEMGFYEADPYGNIGRLQLELLRAVRLVADTGIHAMGWTRDEAIAYLQENLGDASGQWASEVDRYIVRPGQACGYLVGMLEIMRLRQFAMDGLGDQFDIRAFHMQILGHGSLPLEILAQIVEENVQQNR